MGLFIQGAIALACLAIFVSLAYHMTMAYALEEGTPLRRLLAAGRSSLTIVWARVMVLAGALLAMLANGADLVGLPGVADNVKAFLKPEYVPLAAIAIAVISEMARRRTLPADPPKVVDPPPIIDLKPGS
jgi:hypothetical protein